MSKVYIAGAVSSMPYNEAIKKFREAEEFLYNRGDNPVNPIRCFRVESNLREYMRTVIPLLCDCDGIYMMKGWKSSWEAKLEHFIALKLGMKIEIQR